MFAEAWIEGEDLDQGPRLVVAAGDLGSLKTCTCGRLFYPWMESVEMRKIIIIKKIHTQETDQGSFG